MKKTKYALIQVAPQSALRKSCNCSWTCDSAFSGPIACYHENCNETSSGCGFLWLYSCDGRDEMYIEDC